MAKPTLTIAQVLRDSTVFRKPRIVAFNRLEARPRTIDFTRNLRAEVRDPLWMLTRQWQFGETRGEDAGSCVTARIAYFHAPVDRVAFTGADAFAYAGEAIPLETRVEREDVPLTVRRQSDGHLFNDVVFAVQLGKEFLRLLRKSDLDGQYGLYINKFPIRVLPGPVEGELDPLAEEIRQCVANRIADGIAIWLSATSGEHDQWIDSEPGADQSLKSIAVSFATTCDQRFGRLFSEPENEDDSAWLKNHLEYQFAVSPAKRSDEEQAVLFAEQYHNGRMDWYSFDRVNDRKLELGADEPIVDTAAIDQSESFLPSNIRFKGQPEARFWQMEESEMNFGKIETTPTGLLHLLLAEFGLIYSNDWFMLPHPMKINTLGEVRGILVDDNFGRHTFIRPAGQGPETNWQRWAMFRHTVHGEITTLSNQFYLAPTVGKVLESEPIERVNFIRDEMANMVWAIENIVPSQTGEGISGSLNAKVSPPPELPFDLEESVKISYLLGTQVPSNWIPFIAVHNENSVSEVRLQRARMVGGDPPRGRVLRESRSPYFVEEEEVPRAGIYVERTWQRTRWLYGRTHTWIGRKKTAGRGEGSSNLAFDQIVDREAGES